MKRILLSLLFISTICSAAPTLNTTIGGSGPLTGTVPLAQLPVAVSTNDPIVQAYIATNSIVDQTAVADLNRMMTYLRVRGSLPRFLSIVPAWGRFNPNGTLNDIFTNSTTQTNIALTANGLLCGGTNGWHTSLQGTYSNYTLVIVCYSDPNIIPLIPSNPTFGDSIFGGAVNSGDNNGTFFGVSYANLGYQTYWDVSNNVWSVVDANNNTPTFLKMQGTVGAGQVSPFIYNGTVMELAVGADNTRKYYYDSIPMAVTAANAGNNIIVNTSTNPPASPISALNIGYDTNFISKAFNGSRANTNAIASWLQCAILIASTNLEDIKDAYTVANILNPIKKKSFVIGASIDCPTFYAGTYGISPFNNFYTNWWPVQMDTAGYPNSSVIDYSCPGGTASNLLAVANWPGSRFPLSAVTNLIMAGDTVEVIPTIFRNDYATYGFAYNLGTATNLLVPMRRAGAKIDIENTTPIGTNYPGYAANNSNLVYQAYSMANQWWCDRLVDWGQYVNLLMLDTNSTANYISGDGIHLNGIRGGNFQANIAHYYATGIWLGSITNQTTADILGTPIWYTPIPNPVVFTNFLLGTFFTNTTLLKELVSVNARCNPSTTLSALFGLVTSPDGVTYTTNAIAGLEADTIFTTVPHGWFQLTATVPPKGIWEVVDISGGGAVTITNSFYKSLQ